MELWLFTGLLVCLALGAFNTLQKHLVSDYSPVTVGYSTNLIASLFLAPIAIYYFLQFGFPLEALALLVLTGIFNALSFYLLPLALSKEDLGVIAPTRGVSPISIAIIEPVFFVGLAYNLNLVAAGLLAGFGLYIANSEEGLMTPIKNLQSPGVLYGLVSATCISGAVLADRYAVHSVGAKPQVYAFGLVAITSLFLALLRLYKEGQTSLVPEKEFIPVGIARAITVGAGIFTLSIATGTQFNVLVQLSIPLSVLLGYLFLGERKFTGRQVIGSVVIISGIYLIL